MCSAKASAACNASQAIRTRMLKRPPSRREKTEVWRGKGKGRTPCDRVYTGQDWSSGLWSPRLTVFPTHQAAPKMFYSSDRRFHGSIISIPFWRGLCLQEANKQTLLSLVYNIFIQFQNHYPKGIHPFWRRIQVWGTVMLERPSLVAQPTFQGQES